MTKNLTRIDFSKKFDKELKKASLEIKIAFRQRLSLFIQNQFHPTLNNHALTGKLKGCRSININGDWRALFFIDEVNNIIIFESIGTHSQLYK